jgi:MFS family permease
MDTAGALIGPVVAYLILDHADRAYDAVFVVSFLVGLIGLAVLVLFVRNVSPGDGVTTPAPPSWRAFVRIISLPGVRQVACAAGLLGLVTFGDAFVYFTLQRKADFVSSYFPLLYVGTAVAYLALAVPLGYVADRIGRVRVLLAGYVALAGSYALLLVASPTAATFVGVLGLLGCFYAATDGVLAAVVSSLVPAPLRTTGIALVTTILALTRLVASIVFGAAWTWRGPDATIFGFFVATLGAVAASAWLLRPPREAT